MSFPLGKPILVMLAAAVASGAAVLLRPAPPAADQRVWTFAEPHARTYRALAPRYETLTGRSVRIDLVSNLALNMRLTSLLSSEIARNPPYAGEISPYVVEIEIASIARYFRPPVDEVGFLPLNGRLTHSGYREISHLNAPGRPGWSARLVSDGRIYTHDVSRWNYNPNRTAPDAWIDRIVRSRFAPWTKAGTIFGVPHDVHPVTLTYRHDLFSQAGIDLAQAKTWPDFQSKCLQFQSYWRAHGRPHRRAMELALVSAENVIVMLLQRHVNVIDQYDRLHLTDPRVAPTIAFYAQLVAGPRAIGVESSGGRGMWAGDIVAGNTCAFITPDWKVSDLKSFAPSLAGKLRMMPLPVFEDADARTSTWGGTMAGIPRNCSNPDEAWRLLEFLYLSDEAMQVRRTYSDILPPLPEQFDRPEYHRPDPYFGGQSIDELYATLATEIPERYVSPLTVAGQIAVGIVLGRAVDHLRLHGTTQGLESKCTQWLLQADAELRDRRAHGRLGDDALPRPAAHD